MNSRNIYITNTPLATARVTWERVLDRLPCFQRIEVEEIDVDDALGRVTAQPVHAPGSSPFYNAAAMDGIAVRFRETIGASEARPLQLREGEHFVYVNTGNALPDDYDAVIMIEDVHPLDDGVVEIISPVTPWNNVRAIGEDIVATELILPENHLIRPIDLGAMLATGRTRVTVKVSPRALVIPTGSELVQPGEPVRPGQIIEFNSRVIKGYLTQWGADAARSPIVPDDRESLRAAIARAAEDYDMVVTNAGASAGSEDHTVAILRELGEVVVHGVNIKPGKPVILAVVNGKPVVGLPGYPISAVLCMRLFIRPLINRYFGLRDEKPATIEATLARPLASRLGVEEFIRVKLGRVGEHLMATPSGRGAGAVMSLVQADGILTVPAGCEGVGGGERIGVELLRDPDEIDNTLVFIGSHDNILDVIANMLQSRRPHYRLSSAHVGSMGGIMAIRRGEAHMAGTHLLDEETGEYNIPFLRRHLAGVELILVNLAHREQGLLVRKGNPLGIGGFADLARPGVKFINRQRGAGTRLLTDMHLKRLDIQPVQVSGYEREEYTHMNVASAVATGSADTGLAIRAAAVALDLDFIPVAQERYDIIVPKAHEAEEKVAAFLDIIRSSRRFHEMVLDLGGYDLRDCGTVLHRQ